MSARQAWAVIAVFVALTLWLLVGAVTTITSDTPAPVTWVSGDGDRVEVRP